MRITLLEGVNVDAIVRGSLADRNPALQLQWGQTVDAERDRGLGFHKAINDIPRSQNLIPIWEHLVPICSYSFLNIGLGMVAS